jgi:predicted TIM-barrel fold metal-dependent hydrolase
MDMSNAGLEYWRSGLRAFAERPNVWVKLSGFGTFVRRCEIGHWRPLILDTIAIFGPSRCMFGSNFPIESLWTDYGTLMDVFQGSISGLSIEERRLILSKTASNLYRI